MYWLNYYIYSHLCKLYNGAYNKALGLKIHCTKFNIYPECTRNYRFMKSVSKLFLHFFFLSLFFPLFIFVLYHNFFSLSFRLFLFLSVFLNLFIGIFVHPFFIITCSNHPHFSSSFYSLHPLFMSFFLLFLLPFLLFVSLPLLKNLMVKGIFIF